MADNLNPDGGNDSDVSMVNPDGSFTENWAEKYGEENKAHLSRYKDFDALVNSHIATKSKLGRDPDTLVVIPTETSSDEERAEFHRRRGVPETPEGYKYVRSKDLPETIETTDEKVAAFAQIGKKHNLTDGQFNGVVNDYLALIGKDIAAFDLVQKDNEDKEFAEAEKALKKKFGQAYDEKVARANLVLKKYGGQEMVAKLELENNPWMVEVFDKVAEDMSEDRIKGLTKVSTPTPDAIKNRIAEVRSRMDAIVKENPVNFKANTEYKALTEEKKGLYKRAKAS